MNELVQKIAALRSYAWRCILGPGSERPHTRYHIAQSEAQSPEKRS